MDDQDVDGGGLVPPRGRLKVFLGYAPGVGKTHAMLLAGCERAAEGVDVVAASVQTHGRPESERLLERLESVPLCQVAHDGVRMWEMDTDAVLARKPALALVDDLAYVNSRGSKRFFRYQDIGQLLDAGIDVYTTLNVQHLASLSDVVSQITGLVVPVTIPDRVLDDAEEIELVDLPVDELLRRFRAGKVAFHGYDGREAARFFRAGNLSALRELALRRAAERVDEQMRAYMQAQGIVGPWAASERILVCVGPGPLSERLVRAGRRLAARLDAEWFAVYVETPAHASLDEAQSDQLARTLHLAETLGAKSMVLPGRVVAEAVTTFARARNVTKIVVGKPLHGRWRDVLGGSLVDQIVRQSPDIDVYVINSRPKTRNGVQGPTLWERRDGWLGMSLRDVARSGALVSLVTMMGLPLRTAVEPANLVMLYLLGVIIAALMWGRTAAIVTSLLSVLAFDLFYVPPYYRLLVADAEYLIVFGALLLVGLLISTLATRAREQARAGQRRQEQTMILYELSRSLAAAHDLHSVAQAVVRHVQQILDGEATVWARRDGRLTVVKASAGYSTDGEKDEQAARRAVEKRSVVEEEKSDPPSRPTRYLPLITANDVVGVLAVQESVRDEGIQTAEQRRLLEAIASQAAVAVERALLVEEARRAQLLAETEKLHAALLNAISHDLRTPLASITGTLSSLREDDTLLSDEARAALLETAYGEAERLNRLMGNLLRMTQLEAGALRLTMAPHDIEDVLGAALAQMAHPLHGREVRITIPEQRPLAQMDATLMALVLSNLLDNAHKYSPPGSALEVNVRATEESLIVEVLDRGPGIPEHEMARIFEKFYRLPGPTNVSGTGLGLSISRGIVEAHGGQLTVEGRTNGGSVFSVVLPAEPARKPERAEAYDGA